MSAMHLASLRVFCDVARQRSFSLAAQANDITQSAASQIVSQLERRMEVQLIDRSTRPLHLTGLGETFYEGCKSLIEQYQELEDSIRSARAELAGTVRVAAIYSVGLGDMGQYVQRFTERMPKAHVHIEYLHPDRVYEQVLEGSADLGLVSFPRKMPKLEAVAWRDEPMVLACAPKHRLAGKSLVLPSELAGETYVHFDRALTIRRKVDQFLREHGVAIDPTLEFDNIENIKQAVALGAGIALLPEPTLRREVKARTLAAIPIEGLTFVRPLGVIHRKRPRLSPSARKFLEVLLEPEPGPSSRSIEAASLAGGTVSTPSEPPRRNGVHRNGRNH